MVIVSSVKQSYFWDMVEDFPTLEPSETFEFSKGFREWRNSKNRYYVCEIHYTSNPMKDPSTPEGAKWLETAQSGMRVEQWNQEYEIDARALSQAKVYPQFIPDVHLSSFTYQDLPKEWTRYMCIDPGMDAPTAVLWLCVSPDGKLLVYDEYYERHKTITQNANAIKEKEQRHGAEPLVRLIDPSAFKTTLIGSTVATEYAKEGIYVSPANNNLNAGIELVKIWLDRRDKDGDPDIVFSSSLVNLQSEFRRYLFKTRDKPMKGYDHLLDCLRYILMASPGYISEEQVKWKSHRDKLTGYTSFYVQLTNTEKI
jgi:hypothetical protein